METSLSVSEFARLFNINRQTLHFYDQKGLFCPESRDPENHYRRYSRNQISQFSFITYLRTIGFSIEQIKQIQQCGDIDFTMEQLTRQSEHLRKQYQEIFKIERIIQRKLKFVKEKLAEPGLPQVQRCDPMTYITIGAERVLYENEAFYYYPTVVFYEPQSGTGTYEKVFGAYVGLDGDTREYEDRAEQLAPGEYLCFFHRGPYDQIPEEIARVRSRFPELELSERFVCINIADQFLETDPEKFVTEIRIRIQNREVGS